MRHSYLVRNPHPHPHIVRQNISSCKKTYFNVCLTTLGDTLTPNGSSLWLMVPHRHACGACDYFRVCGVGVGRIKNKANLSRS